MTVKTELLKAYISDFVCNRIEDFEIDAASIAIKIPGEIQSVIMEDSNSDETP